MDNLFLSIKNISYFYYVKVNSDTIVYFIIDNLFLSIKNINYFYYVKVNSDTIAYALA